MKSPLIRITAWLVRDTFQQSLASGIFWILLGISVLCIVVCASIGVSGDVALAYPGENPDFLPRNDPELKDTKKVAESGVAVIAGELTLAWGSISVPLPRDAHNAVHFVQLILAGGVADTLGLLLTLIWTAGFLPGFLDPRSVSVLLAKPPPRWSLLLGKYLGVLTFVLFHSTIFVVGTWLALGLRTGVWDTSYLFSVPLLLLHFAIFFSFSLMLAVASRSTVVCVFGSIAFWMMCWGMNYGRHAVFLAADVAPETGLSSQIVWLANLAYWLLPKPADLGVLLFDALGAANYFGQMLDTATLERSGCLSLPLSVVTSLAFTAVVLLVSAREFAKADY